MADQFSARVRLTQHVNVNDAEIRAQMVRLRMNQILLADALGITQQGLSRRLLGSQDFTMDELGRIAEVLHCDVAQFLSDAAA